MMAEIIPEDTVYEDVMLKMCYKFSTDMMFGVCREEILKKLKNFSKSSKSVSIDYAKCKEFRENAYDIFHSNKYLLRDFRRSTKKLKREISEDMVTSYIAIKSNKAKN